MVESTGFGAVCPRPQREPALTASPNSISRSMSPILTPAVRNVFQDVEHLFGSPTAGYALAAGFELGEGEEVLRHIHHAGILVQDNHAARTHDGTGFRQCFIINGRIQKSCRQTSSRGTSRLYGLETFTAGNASADVINNLPEGRPHGNLDQTAVRDLPGEGKDGGTLAFLRADTGIPLCTLSR